jgi:succinate-acetate transporter protein
MEATMRIIRARRDDWVPNNPRIHVGGWIGAFFVVAAIYIAIAALIGHFINGNGSPFLGS